MVSNVHTRVIMFTIQRSPPVLYYKASTPFSIAS